MRLNENLQALRNQLSLTQQAVSEATEIPRPNLARYETGENVPPLDILIRLADFYDISLDELVCRKEI
jgi:transcriptional regulator with XRE-family HTH domain